MEQPVYPRERITAPALVEEDQKPVPPRSVEQEVTVGAVATGEAAVKVVSPVEAVKATSTPQTSSQNSRPHAVKGADAQPVTPVISVAQQYRERYDALVQFTQSEQQEIEAKLGKPLSAEQKDLTVAFHLLYHQVDPTEVIKTVWQSPTSQSKLIEGKQAMYDYINETVKAATKAAEKVKSRAKAQADKATGR